MAQIAAGYWCTEKKGKLKEPTDIEKI